MSKYGQVAIQAANASWKGTNPIAAWKQSAQSVFPTQKSSREKGCPRCAFLGLAEAGLIKGVPPGSYTRSKDNKRYAVDAVQRLKKSPGLASDPAKLWDLISSGNKQHNGQLDVVIDLWDNGYL